jgi:hypothetical protein
LRGSQELGVVGGGSQASGGRTEVNQFYLV